MILKRFFSCLWLCFVVVLSSYSQSSDKAVLLKNILKSIEKKHNVNFNYLEDEIALFKIIPPQEKISLKEKLNYISQKTDLEFKFISNNYISISNNKKLDKPLCGYIIDEISNLPIANVSVHYKNTNTFTTTDEDGYFQLPYKAANEIEISHLNYEKRIIQSLELNKEVCPKIILKETFNQLDEVAATVILTKGISKRNDGTYVITPKKFGLLPGLTEPDVFQTMQQLPGITSVDETISNINVRGGTHDQNLFLWNGIRLFQTGHFFGLISALNPNLANKISISKNGTSAFYGESVSSAVDISSHTDSKENENSIGVNLINFDFNSTLKTSKNGSLSFSARRSINDFIKTPTYTNYYNRIFQNTLVTNLIDNQDVHYETHEKFNFYDFTTQFQQKIGKKNTLYIDGIWIENKLDLNQDKYENNQEIVKNSSLEQENIGGNILLDTKWNSKWQSKLNLYTSYYAVSSENQSIVNNQIFNQENNVLDIGAKLEINHQIHKNIQLNYGYQFNETGIRNTDKINSPSFSRDIKDVLKIHAAIIELKYSSTNNILNSKIGVRNNYIEKFNKYLFEPRFQLNYAFSKHFNAEILAEIKSQTSSQIIDLQQDFLGIEKRRWVLSNNDNIPIVKNKQASIGFSYKKNNWLITLDNFYKKVTGITSSSQAFQNQFEFKNTKGDYTVYGTEVLLQKQFLNFTNWVTYSYNDNKYLFNEFVPPSFSNNFEIKHNVGFGTIYDIKKFKIALGARWYSGKPNTLPLSNTPIYITPETPEIAYDQANSSKLNDYLQVNASTVYTYEFSKKSKLQLGISVQNILNRKNIINQHYRINNNTNTIEQVNTYSLELTPNGFLRFYF